MRRITLPDIMFNVLSKDGQGLTTINAAQQLYQLVMYAQSEKGFTLEEIRSRLPLGEKLDNAKGVLLLEDAEYSIVQDAFKEASWRGVSPNVIALADAIESAEAVNIDEVASSKT